MSRGSAIISAMAIITLIFVFYVDGGFNGFAVWNATPIIIAMIALLIDKTMKGLRYAVYGFACTIIFILFVFHVSYLADIGKTVSIPLLSGQKLYGLPVYAIGAGYVVGMIGVAIGALHDNKAEKQPDKAL